MSQTDDGIDLLVAMGTALGGLESAINGLNNEPLAMAMDPIADQWMDILGELPLPETQEAFVKYLELLRNEAWDISSALSHDDFDTEMMYGPSEGNEEEWDKIYTHFRDIHQLNVIDPRINWDFDT